MKNKRTWAVLCVAVVVVAVACVFVKAFTPERQRFHFHNPSTVFDSKTGKVYEISGDEGYVVEFDVVGGKKIRRQFIVDEKTDEENFARATNALRRIVEDAALALADNLLERQVFESAAWQ